MKPTYEQLEQQLAAVVAENAALKKSEAEFNEYCRTECENAGDTWVDDFTETPATDAYLAEVRAQESAPLVRALKVIANSEQYDGETVVCDFGTLISVAAGALRDHFAAQLRQGDAQ